MAELYGVDVVGAALDEDEGLNDQVDDDRPSVAKPDSLEAPEPAPPPDGGGEALAEFIPLLPLLA